jgi:hypothetical protein
MLIKTIEKPKIEIRLAFFINIRQLYLQNFFNISINIIEIK